MPAPTHLIVGLGNPGPDYHGTRHNIGFMAVERIAELYNCPPWKNKFKGLLTAPNATDHHFLLLKPQTYMNLSGESVGEAMRFHKLSPSQIVVFHDDLDLQPGDVRVKQGGGAGGHNGLKSIDEHIGKDYWRVRLGIGHPGEKGDVVTNYVLGAFAKAERPWRDALIEAIAKEFSLLVSGRTTEYAGKLAAVSKGVM